MIALACGSVLLSALILVLLNKTYNILQTTSLSYAIAFAVVSLLFPSTLFGSGTDAPMALFACINFSLLLMGRGRSNTTQEMFIIGTLVAIASMWEYAALLSAPLYLLAALMLRQLRLRETLAFLLGIVAPFWCLLGLGILDIASIRIPVPQTIFTAAISGTQAFFTVAYGFAVAAATLLLMFVSTTSIWPMNSATRRYISALNMIAVGSLVLMLLDFGNFGVYASMMFIPFSFLLGLMLKTASPGARVVTWSILVATLGTLFTFYLL